MATRENVSRRTSLLMHHFMQFFSLGNQRLSLPPLPEGCPRIPADGVLFCLFSKLPALPPLGEPPSQAKQQVIFWRHLTAEILSSPASCSIQAEPQLKGTTP